MENDVVWLHTKRTFGFLIQRNAYYSVVLYTQGGIDYEVEVENDDYDVWEDRATEYESE